MYKNNIIVLIKKDGQPLRETGGKFVHLPFYSEYSIELKNDSWRRAIASIKIDGTDVLGGDEIIIPPRDSVNVERFITDGNLNEGRKLKFVTLSDLGVQDPSSPENGLVEIEVWFEKVSTFIYTTNYSNTNEFWPWDSSSSWRNKPRSSGGSYGSMEMKCCNFASDSTLGVVHDSADAGATVEGAASSQSFSRGHFGEKEYPSTTFKLWLRGVQKEVTVKDKIYCTNCGKKTRFDYKFCPRCGCPVQIA